MTRKALSICLIATLLISCNNTINNKDKHGNSKVLTISIDLGESIKHNNFSDIFQVVDIVKLETIKASQFGAASEIRATNLGYYIKDEYKQLLLFNNAGLFITKFGRIGLGPGEFSSISSFSVWSDKCMVFSSSQKKVIFYNQDGSFLKESKIDLPAVNASFLDDDHMAMMCLSGDNSIFILNKGLRIINSFQKFNLQYLLSVKPRPFTIAGPSLFYREDLNDTIYKVTPEGNIPSRIISFGKDAITRDEFLKTGKPTRPDGPRKPPLTKAYDINEYLESDSLICFKFTSGYNGKRFFYQVIYNKKNENSIVYTVNLQDDYFFTSLPPFIKELKGDTLIYAISPVDLLSHKDLILNKPGVTGLMTTINSINNTDNPLLVKLLIKPH